MLIALVLFVLTLGMSINNDAFLFINLRHGCLSSSGHVYSQKVCRCIAPNSHHSVVCARGAPLCHDVCLAFGHHDCVRTSVHFCAIRLMD